MKSFEYTAPKSLKDASPLLSDSWGKTELLAGGTDLVTALKQHLTTPSRLVSLKNISELKSIEASKDSIRIGATVTLQTLADHPLIKQHFPSLITAIHGIGSPQLLTTGTVGGDLCQRHRCWYFRNGYGSLGKDGNTSLVRQGDNRYHAIFGNQGDALFVNPSSLAPALIALGATLEITTSRSKLRQTTADKFFQTPKTNTDRETTLQSNEILTWIHIPIAGLKNATYEVRHRHGLDWPYVTASVAFKLNGNSASNAQIVLGHVAPIPWLASQAAQTLNSASPNASTATQCGQAAAQGASPLSGNAYKIQLVKTAVKRAILAAA